MPFSYSNSGVVTADTSTVLAEVQAEYTNAFGGDFITDPETPQGVLIAGEAQARTDALNFLAGLANQINPNLAEGQFLDAICAMTGTERFQGTPSTVIIQFSGLSGTDIPAGTGCIDADGNIWNTITDVTIGSAGIVTVQANCSFNAAVLAAANSIQELSGDIAGVSSLTNPAPSTVGYQQESDSALRTRRMLSVAQQGQGSLLSIQAALYAIADVNSFILLENNGGSAQTQGDISIPAHSIYLAIDGGTDAEIGEALLRKKPLGCGTSGTSSVTIYDISGAAQTAHVINFTRPSQVPIYIEVDIINTAGNALYEDVVREAVMAYANGENGNARGFVVGQDVSAVEIGAAIISANIGVYIKNITVNSAAFVTINLDQIPVTYTDYITVKSVGQ